MINRDVIFTILSGRNHGDLHPGNILVSPGRRGDLHSFWLIDLGGYAPDAQILQDAADLMLVTILNLVRGGSFDWSAVRRSLLKEGVDLSCAGIVFVVDACWKAVRDGLDERTLKHDILCQWRLAVILGSLRLASRTALERDESEALFVLAGHLAGEWADVLGLTLPALSSDPTVLQSRRYTTTSATQLIDACGGFDGNRITLLLVDHFELKKLGYEIGLLPWTGVIALEEVSELDSLYRKRAQDASGLPHQMRDERTVAPITLATTTWVSAGNDEDQRQWLLKRKPAVETFLNNLARASSRDVTVVLSGSDRRLETLAESVLGAFGERASVIQLLLDSESTPKTYLANEQLTVKIKDLFVEIRSNLGQVEVARGLPTVPGREGPVDLTTRDLLWFKEHLELVHSDVGRSSMTQRLVGEDFYRGGDISWFEIDLHVHVARAVEDLLGNQIELELEEASLVTISLRHAAGAGGSTAARSLAWRFHDTHPTVVVNGAVDEVPIFERIVNLRTRTSLPVLVVIENMTEGAMDRLYQRLRSSSHSAVILVVERGPAPREVQPRSQYLGTISTRKQKIEFADAFAQYQPLKQSVLKELALSEPDLTPFLFGLTAFENDFVGVVQYVEHSLAHLSDPERAVAQMVALVHAYSAHGVPRTVLERLDRRLLIEPDSYIEDLLVSSGPNAESLVRSRHYVIASEILIQSLGFVGDRSESWRVGLAVVTRKLLDVVSAHYATGLPEAVELMIRKLLVDRPAMDFVENSPRAFSELITAIPTAAERVAVMRQAATQLDLDYLWAHYGRLLSQETGDYSAALTALDRACLMNESTTNFHMRAIVHRNEANRVRELAARSDGDEVRAFVDQAMGVYELASEDLLRAISLDGSNEYALVTMVQICRSVFDMVRRAEKLPSFSAARFSQRYGVSVRSWFDRATEAVANLREFEDEMRLSGFAGQALAWYSQIQDDYARLLQRLDNLLGRRDVLPNPIRRQVVEAYCGRAGGWRSLPDHEVSRSLDLLEANLTDDPTDGASIRQYIQIARLGGRSLETAVAHVSLWASGKRPPPQALFYHQVLLVLQVLDGSKALAQDADDAERRLRKLDDSQVRVRNARLEWYGPGRGLRALVHNSELAEWDRGSHPGGPRGVLARVSGRVTRIQDGGSGWFTLDEAPEIEVHIVPRRAGLERGRDEGRRLTSLLSFTYSGLKGWDPALAKD